VYDLVIEGATLVTGTGRRVADVAVSDGTIAYVGERPGGAARERVDGAGAFLLPGLVDTHVHFRDPGHPHKECWASGSAAAVSGGVTTVCDMPNTSPPTLTREAWEDKRARAAAASHADFGLWVGASSGNHDAIRDLMDSGDACGIKVFMGASTGPLLVDPDTLARLYAETTGLIGVHAEDEAALVPLRGRFAQDPAPDHNSVRPPLAAVAAVRHLLTLVEAHARPTHICHLSTAAELALVEPRRHAIPITTEVCPHHLFLCAEEPQGNYTKVNPPIRAAVDRDALWEALGRDALDTVGSDHAPHTHEEKRRPYWDAPAGLPGVETIFPLLMRAVREGRMDLERFVRMTSETPARIFGLARKGRLEVGADADIVLHREADLVTLAASDLLTRVGWSPFVGMPVVRKPASVWLRGRKVAEHGRIVSEARGTLVRPGRGKVAASG
jgi:dihydroorotase